MQALLDSGHPHGAVTDLDHLIVQVVAHDIGVAADQALLDSGHPHGAVTDLDLLIVQVVPGLAVTPIYTSALDEVKRN